MPRYLVRCRIGTTYRRLVDGADEAAVAAAIAALATPAPFGADWRLEAGPVVRSADTSTMTDGTLRAEASCDVVARVTMAVRADDAASARKAAEEACSESRDDVPSSAAPDRWHSRRCDRVVSTEEPRRDDGPIRPRRSFEVDVRRLIAPNASLHPLHVDQAFETLRWMAATGSNYEQQCSHHVQRITHLLCGGGDRSDERIRIESEADLKDRFQHAVLGIGYDIYDQWREEHGIRPTARLTVDALHHGPNTDRFDSHVRSGTSRRWAGLGVSLWEICRSLPGLRTRVQLNPYHPNADRIISFGVLVGPGGFVFQLRYGYEGSSWTTDVARTRGGETFAETLDRALVVLAAIVPDMDEQAEGRRLAERRRSTQAIDLAA
jgi:hypothetical protein